MQDYRDFGSQSHHVLFAFNVVGIGNHDWLMENISDKVGTLLRQQVSENRLVAAICAAPIALKAHGIAKGKKVTCYPTMKDQLKDDYTWIDEKVVTDGDTITSQGPSTAYLFGLAIIEKLIGKAEASAVAKGLLCDEYK